MGIFSKSNQPDPKVKRNTFDLSFQNNLTLDFGTLYPCFCKEVIPGDTFKIDVAFGLRFLPLAFPIQTKMRADVHFFYVRNRNLWKDWPNFIGMTGSNDYVPPYIPYKKVCKTGGLGDYLGLPTTVVGNNQKNVPFTATPSVYPADYWLAMQNAVSNYGASSANFLIGEASSSTGELPPEVACFPVFYGSDPYCSYFAINSTSVGVIPKGAQIQVAFSKCDVSNPVFYLLRSDAGAIDYFKSGTLWRNVPGVSVGSYNPSSKILTFDVLSDIPAGVISRLAIFSADNMPVEEFAGVGELPSEVLPTNVKVTSIYTIVPDYNVLEADSNGVYADAMPNVSALPFRAYESIYNAFYRDQRNNPYLVDGVNDPNVYLPTKDGGIDVNEYVFHRRNWEQDFLTSAVPSPQQGIAPLVGITSTGVATFSDDGQTYSVQLETADDGDTVTGAKMSENLPSSVARSVVDIANQGISINDFRGVNALQRWLETNMRRGLKYKDQILSHFGVDVSYAELDMPEFIGGCSQMVDIQQINQTSETNSDPLGSYAGQAAAVGGNNHTISNYCDEHGFIIGIVSVVPVPCYSQLLPKYFLKTNPLDHFFPEFGHLGMQAIPYREVCPLQLLYSRQGAAALNGTFGYQRAWYEYLASTDEVHGLFRTSLRHFLLGRVYNTVPSLNEDFLTVNSDQLNDVFTVTETTDEQGNTVPLTPILGQLHFKVVAKRPIPRFGVPRLE
ncbi:major capsid protein [Microvirus mar55]|uniref:Major capsid protein n=1 Tax=Microvirus mar55 TaxID=2851191 RepID=A0A8F5MKF1_9VIRU|nr:major capsid protein [Microvirus mar55]